MELMKHNECIYLNCLTMNKEDLSALKAYITYFSKLNNMEISIIMKSKIADVKLIKFNVEYKETTITPQELKNIINTLYMKNEINKKNIDIETVNGIQKIMVQDPMIDLGKPSMNAKKIPVMTDQNVFINQTIHILDQNYSVTGVFLKEAYIVVFVDQLNQLSLDQIGFYFENYRQFPQKVHVVFAEVIDEKTIQIKVWKKGRQVTLLDNEDYAVSVVAAVWNHILKQDQEIKVCFSDQKTKVTYQQDEHIIIKPWIKQPTFVKK